MFIASVFSNRGKSNDLSHMGLPVLLVSSPTKENRECTEGYSRWKVEKRYGKFSQTGLNNWSISKSPKGGTVPGVWKGKRSLLASHTIWKCSTETIRNSVKVNPGIKVLNIGRKSGR